MAKRKVPILLADGKPRNLLYNFNALIELVETLGVDIMNIQAALTGPGALKAIRGILWAGLIHEDESLNLKATGNLIDMTKIQEITKAITTALTLAFGVPNGGPKNAEPPESPATEANPSTVPAS